VLGYEVLNIFGHHVIVVMRMMGRVAMVAQILLGFVSASLESDPPVRTYKSIDVSIQVLCKGPDTDALAGQLWCFSLTDSLTYS
jgi:hypothetical protein